MLASRYHEYHFIMDNHWLKYCGQLDDLINHHYLMSSVRNLSFCFSWCCWSDANRDAHQHSFVLFSWWKDDDNDDEATAELKLKLELTLSAVTVMFITLFIHFLILLNIWILLKNSWKHHWMIFSYFVFEKRFSFRSACYLDPPSANVENEKHMFIMPPSRNNGCSRITWRLLSFSSVST